MKFCKQFLNKPSTRKALHKKFKPVVHNILKYTNKTIKHSYKKNEMKPVVESLLNHSLEAFNKSFMKLCSKGCREFENTPYPCGPENEKILLRNIQNIDSQKLSNNTIKLLDYKQSIKHPHKSLKHRV